MNVGVTTSLDTESYTQWKKTGVNLNYIIRLGLKSHDGEYEERVKTMETNIQRLQSALARMSEENEQLKERLRTMLEIKTDELLENR